MDPVELAAILAVGFVAGVTSGLLGVGGGVIFVPGLVILLGEGQLEAEATSLLAVVVVAGAGAWRQQHYGNLRLRDGVLIGVLSPVGVVAGVVIANEVPERGLEIGFAVVQLYFAWRLVRGLPEAPA
ncbi:MAG TPA: TSUP family transporter [Thermoleophilaceae bacterium]|nr:TSUP family transporter [Thermoleophilaceae bacterium]